MAESSTTSWGQGGNVKRGITNLQKAQVLLDVMQEIPDISKAIDKSISRNQYQIHPEKVKAFKDEMNILSAGRPDVKKALGISFKTLGILEKMERRFEDAEKRKKDEMATMVSKLK